MRDKPYDIKLRLRSGACVNRQLREIKIDMLKMFENL